MPTITPRLPAPPPSLSLLLYAFCTSLLYGGALLRSGRTCSESSAANRLTRVQQRHAAAAAPTSVASRTDVHAGSLQSTESWAALNTQEAPALVTAAARLLAEDAEQKRKRKRPRSPAPSPSPDPAWQLTQQEYEAVLACAEAAAEHRSALEVCRVCNEEAAEARAAYEASEADLRAREDHVEGCERRAAELAWPRSPAKCRRKGRRFDPAAAKLQRERLLATARRGRAALASASLAARDLLITDDVAQLSAWQARQALRRADREHEVALAALSPTTRHRAVAAGLLGSKDCVA